MDGRLLALIVGGVICLIAAYFAPETYTYSWAFLGVLALGWSGVVVFRNSRRKPGKHLGR